MIFAWVFVLALDLFASIFVTHVWIVPYQPPGVVVRVSSLTLLGMTLLLTVSALLSVL